MIVADGGSTDGTQEIARLRRRQGDRRRPRLWTRLSGRRRGRRNATSSFSWMATVPIAAICWGGLPARSLAGTHDFVLASRTLGERDPGSMLWHQVLAGRMAGWGMGALYGVRYSDMCAYRAISRDALSGLDMREMTYGWNIEMQMKAARGWTADTRRSRCPIDVAPAGSQKSQGRCAAHFVPAGKIVSTFVRVAIQRAPA